MTVKYRWIPFSKRNNIRHDNLRHANDTTSSSASKPPEHDELDNIPGKPGNKVPDYVYTYSQAQGSFATKYIG